MALPKEREGRMTKDEALDLALKALEACIYPQQKQLQAITAIKQARALDKMAENARELGLDYDPAGGTQVSKVWWDGEKLMAKPIPLEDIYQPAPVQEDWGPGPHEYHSLTAAQRQWVGLTDEEVRETISSVHIEPLFSYRHVARAIEAKLKEKNT